MNDEESVVIKVADINPNYIANMRKGEDCVIIDIPHGKRFVDTVYNDILNAKNKRLTKKLEA